MHFRGIFFLKFAQQTHSALFCALLALPVALVIIRHVSHIHQHRFSPEFPVVVVAVSPLEAEVSLLHALQLLSPELVPQLHVSADEARGNHVTVIKGSASAPSSDPSPGALQFKPGALIQVR